MSMNLKIQYQNPKQNVFQIHLRILALIWRIREHVVTEDQRSEFSDNP